MSHSNIYTSTVNASSLASRYSVLHRSRCNINTDHILRAGQNRKQVAAQDRSGAATTHTRLHTYRWCGPPAPTSGDSAWPFSNCGRAVSRREQSIKEKTANINRKNLRSS